MESKGGILKIPTARVASSDIVIVARTDAIFPEALQSEEEFKCFAKEVNAPLLANMTEFGKTPYYTAEQFEARGYKMVICPVRFLRVAAKSIRNVYQPIQETGTQKDKIDHMQTRKELYETIKCHEELDHSAAKTILPKSF